jgi:hypothetical protein
MGHIERGEKNLSFNTLVRLSEALSITLPELLSETQTDTKPSKASSKTRPRNAASRDLHYEDDLSSIIRELNMQRDTLAEAAGALKNVAKSLRTHERRLAKR